MGKAINDANFVNTGDIFQYYVTLRDCINLSIICFSKWDGN